MRRMGRYNLSGVLAADQRQDRRSLRTPPPVVPVRTFFCRGPLSQWLVNALTAADLPVICVETRHMKALLTAQQINKTDRNDARGIAQMMRVGLFKPVHVKTLVAQEQRMLLTSRKLLQRKLLDVECELRGTLRNLISASQI